MIIKGKVQIISVRLLYIYIRKKKRKKIKRKKIKRKTLKVIHNNAIKMMAYKDKNYFNFKVYNQ